MIYGIFLNWGHWAFWGRPRPCKPYKPKALTGGKNRKSWLLVAWTIAAAALLAMSLKLGPSC